MPEPPRKKTTEEQLREIVNAKGVEIVQDGFDAIDEFAEIAKAKLKRTILKALTGNKRPRR
jgi:hypothetical protein